MAFDYEVASKGIISAINNMAALKTQNMQMENALLADAIKQKREFAAKKAEKQIMTPFEMIQARQYQAQNPDMDFSGIPGFSQQPRPAGAPQAQPAGDVFSETPQPRLEPTSSGFSSKTPSTKEYIYQRIQQKKNSGQPLTEKEQKYERKYLGIDDEKTELKPEDRIRLRKLAKEMAVEAGEFSPTEEVIKRFLPQAKNFLYPNVETKDDISVDIQLPKNVKDTVSAIKYLTDNGMSEMEARDWLKARMRKR